MTQDLPPQALGRPAAPRSVLAATAGLVVPGLGLAIRGDLSAGLLTLAAVVHCAALGTCSLAALASRGDVPKDAVATAWTALQSGILSPQAAMMWVLAVGLHLWAAWSAYTAGAAKDVHAPAAPH